MWNSSIKKSMIHNKNFFLMMAIWILMFSPHGYAKLPALTDDQEAYFQEGLLLIEKFYGYIFSKDELKDCPDLFEEVTGTTSTREREKEVTQIWKFIRENISLFTGGPLLNRPPDEFFSRAGKRYNIYLTHLGDPKGELIIGRIEIVLICTLGVRSGISKEITFPIYFSEKQNRYVIDAIAMKINGVTLDWTTLSYIEGTRKWERDFDWLEQLGFPKKKESSR